MSESRASNVRKRTCEALLQQVLSGKWPAGERLPSERQLAIDLAASRATVREAIQHLVSRGLLVSRRGSGLYARAATGTEVMLPSAAPPLSPVFDQPLWRADMLEFRLMFECGTARLAAVRANAEQRRGLGAVIERMRAAIATEDVDEEAAADAAFHELLAASAHNLMIHRFHASVIDTLRRHITRNTYDASRRHSPLSRQRCLERLHQHEDIHTAIMARSPDLAEQAMRTHIIYVGAQFVGERRDASGMNVYRRPDRRR